MSSKAAARTPPAKNKTIAYLIEQFKAAGLQPGGDLKDGKRLWTQAVPLGRFEIEGPVAASVSLGGKPQALQQGEQLAIRAAMNGQTAISIKDAPLVFVGYGVTAPERDWNDFKGVDLKGKIAVVLINDPDFETGVGDFGGKAMTYYGRWTYKFEEMARQGAVGTMIVHETAPASYGWPTVKNSNTNVMFDIVRKEPGKSHAPMESWIQRDAAVAWFKQAGLDFEALKKQAQDRTFKPVELKGVTFSADYAVEAQVITSQNVVARRDGSKHADETVLYSGHWDHLGVGAAECIGRYHLQRRHRQRHRHGGHDRTGARLCQGAENPAFGGVPGGDRRGKGPARLRVLRVQSALSAGQNRWHDQHGRAVRRCSGPQLHDLRQRKA